MTEAERQAERYDQDPDGTLQWFIDHPSEADEWTKNYLVQLAQEERRPSPFWFVVRAIVTATFFGGIVYIVVAYLIPMVK